MFAVPWCKGTKNISSCIVYAPSSAKHASGSHGSFHLRPFTLQKRQNKLDPTPITETESKNAASKITQIQPADLILMIAYYAIYSTCHGYHRTNDSPKFHP